MFSYKVKDLYIGVLGYVTQDYYFNLRIDPKDSIIIYKKEKLDSFGNYYAKEIFTNQKFYFYQGNKYDSDTIYKAIDNLAIFSSIPLSTIISKKRITKKELEELYHGINEKINPRPKEELEEPSILITDSILQMILDTSKKVKNSNIDEYLKDEILTSLENLSEYYVQKIINKLETKDDNKLELTTENEYTIKMETMKRLVEIEQSYQNPENIKKYSLKRQLIQVKKDLN